MKSNTKKKTSGISDRIIIQHAAIIMDGNGRWANQRGMNRSEGHKASKNAIREAIKAAIHQHIPYLSLFAFSTENWKRPKIEINYLFDIFSDFLIQETPDLMEQGVKIITSGSLIKFPVKMQNVVQKTMDVTSDNKVLQVNLCLDYSGRSEIVHAVRSAIQQGVSPEEIDEKTFEQFFYHPELPPIDLLIRTSGEQRISNFMLWQIAYAELVFIPIMFPDFTEKDFDAAVQVFTNRDRRYGGL